MSVANYNPNDVLVFLTINFSNWSMAQKKKMKFQLGPFGHIIQSILIGIPCYRSCECENLLIHMSSLNYLLHNCFNLIKPWECWVVASIWIDP